MGQHVTKDANGNNLTVRSKLETKIVDILSACNSPWEYEVTKIKYKIPESVHTYTVDFTLKNGVLLEGKGYLSDHAERYKYILIKQQNPEADIRFIFDNPNKLVGGTKMTHAKWAEKYGFRYCSIKDTEQIESWLKEKNVKDLSN